MDENTLKEGFLGQKMIAFPKSFLVDIKNNPISRNFYISDLGYYPVASHHYRLRKKGAKEYIFIYCTRGKGEIIIKQSRKTRASLGKSSQEKYINAALNLLSQR